MAGPSRTRWSVTAAARSWSWVTSSRAQPCVGDFGHQAVHGRLLGDQVQARGGLVGEDQQRSGSSARTSAIRCSSPPETWPGRPLQDLGGQADLVEQRPHPGLVDAVPAHHVAHRARERDAPRERQGRVLVELLQPAAAGGGPCVTVPGRRRQAQQRVAQRGLARRRSAR